MQRERAPILIVNDDEAVAEALRQLLERDGYAVATATDGWDALTQLYNGLRPCLILLDLMMPVMDGYEFREQQLRLRDLADIPIVVMSSVFDMDSAGVRSLGAQAYLEVPVDLGKLVRIVRNHCATVAR